LTEITDTNNFLLWERLPFDPYPTSLTQANPTHEMRSEIQVTTKPNLRVNPTHDHRLSVYTHYCTVQDEYRPILYHKMVRSYQVCLSVEKRFTPACLDEDVGRIRLFDGVNLADLEEDHVNKDGDLHIKQWIWYHLSAGQAKIHNTVSVLAVQLPHCTGYINLLQTQYRKQRFVSVPDKMQLISSSVNLSRVVSYGTWSCLTSLSIVS